LYSEKWVQPLTEMRSKGDPLADAIVELVYQHGDLEAVNDILRTLVKNDGILDANMHPEIRNFLDHSNDLPPWADLAKLQHGSAIFNIHALQMVMMLFAASLPTLYAAKKGAEVLVLTDRMVEYTLLERRIMETAQFVMDVTEENAFTPDGMGIIAVQKVRLIHSAIRCCIKFDPTWATKWDNEWGCPINQVDLAGTMLSFSTTVLEGLSRSSVGLSLDEKEAYLHLWMVIGHLLGIDDALMPANYADSIDMMDTALKLNHAPSAGGQLLAKVLVEFLHRHIPVYKSYITGVMRYWIGNFAADCLNLPKYRWTMSIFQIQRLVWAIESRFQREIPFVGAFSRRLNRRLLLAILDLERQGNRPPFRLPNSLRDQLNF